MSAEQVIVILGCRVQPGGDVRGALGRRVALGASLYHERKGGWVLVSGGKVWDSLSEARAMRRELMSLGVPSDAIQEESRSHSTRENARFTQLLLSERGVGRVGLVTCDFHMRRAARLFREYGLAVEEYPAPSPISNMTRARRALSEVVKAALDEYLPRGLGARYLL